MNPKYKIGMVFEYNTVLTKYTFEIISFSYSAEYFYYQVEWSDGLIDQFSENSINTHLLMKKFKLIKTIDRNRVCKKKSNA